MCGILRLDLTTATRDRLEVLYGGTLDLTPLSSLLPPDWLRWFNCRVALPGLSVADPLLIHGISCAPALREMYGSR